MSGADCLDSSKKKAEFDNSRNEQVEVMIHLLFLQTFCIIFVSKYGNYKVPSLHVWVTCFLNYEVYCMFKVVNDLYLLNILYFNCSKIYAMMRNKTQHLDVSRNVFVNQNS